MDKREGRVQPIRLLSEFFPLDIRKSIFINDLMITIPADYAKSWGEEVLQEHNKANCKWEVEIDYITPKDLGSKRMKFKATLTLGFSKNRNRISNYRLKWNNDFAIQLAKDYPKSFVRALEFHIGDDYYKDLKYTEFDIGGFKEQLQVKISWEKNKPTVTIKELFRVKEQEQGFPKVFQELSSYLIADYLLSSEDELLRRIQITPWKKRKELQKELNENNIYILLNREKNKIYFGETKQSFAKRYPINQKHHSFDDWSEYSIIQLPPETSDSTRLLIERVLIAVGAKLFLNKIYDEEPIVKNSLELQNSKK